jgi:hypothetical protein
MERVGKANNNIRDVDSGETSKLLVRRHDGTDDIGEINLTKEYCSLPFLLSFACINSLPAIESVLCTVALTFKVLCSTNLRRRYYQVSANCDREQSLIQWKSVLKDTLALIESRITQSMAKAPQRNRTIQNVLHEKYR